MKQIMRAIEPILFDLKDGSLKRVKKSNFVRFNKPSADGGADEIGELTIPTSPTPETVSIVQDLLLAVDGQKSGKSTNS